MSDSNKRNRSTTFTPFSGTGYRLRDSAPVNNPQPQHAPPSSNVNAPPAFPGTGYRLQDSQPFPGTPVQRTPPRPMPGNGQPSGFGNAQEIMGSMMVTRKVAHSINNNVGSRTPAIRPSLGEVGNATWTLSGGTPHTGIQGNEGEPKDVNVNVRIRVPQQPTPSMFGATPSHPPAVTQIGDQQLDQRMGTAKQDVVNDPTAIRKARETFTKQATEHYEKNPPKDKRKVGQLIDQQVKDKLDSRAKNPKKISDASAEKFMWAQIGRETGRSNSGVTQINIGDNNPLSRQGPGQFTVIGNQARHHVHLTDESRQALNDLRRDSVAANYQAVNQFLGNLHLQRRAERAKKEQ